MLDDDSEVNPVLLYKLASVFGAATEELAEQPAEHDRGRCCAARPRPPRSRASRSPSRRVIGTFTYAKLPMVRDLQAAE